MIDVVAKYVAVAGSEESVARALQEYAPLTRAEAGCERFVVLRSRDQPQDFVLYEEYLDLEALDSHRSSAHFSAVARDRIWPMLAGRDVTICDVLEP